jgi:anaerobic magnesium-protoporphyrin IX monomethyl ester cyclase
VFPTYHWREILQREPQIDVIVRGEGERTCVALFRALQDGGDLRAIRDWPCARGRRRRRR